MDLNLIQIIFVFFTVNVALLGSVIKVAEQYLPIEIRNLFRYGKFVAEGKNSILPTLQVPKRWFKHFYEFSAPAATCILFIAVRTYLGIGTVPQFIHPILDILLGENRQPLVSPEHTVLALTLLTIQCWKRFYETHNVCVFSNGKINLGHYVLGYLHYAGALVCMIGESVGFFQDTDSAVNWNKLKYTDYVFAIIFLWASYEQLTCNLILASLRKNKKGEVVTLQHKVPRGGLFEYISSPLQTTEILMYFMLALILRGSYTYNFIFLWVFVNQVGTGLFGHWWYIETFKDYPKQRKALIPFIL